MDIGENAFRTALERYSNAFQEQGLPFLLGVHQQAQPVAVALLNGTVDTGQPLGWWAVMSALGIRKPPEGVHL